ncbi:hypothetical protein UlMin_034655 [Ulmus minor]
MAFSFNNLFFLLLTLFFTNIPFLHSLSTVSISETSNRTLICALIPQPNNQKQHFLNCTSFQNNGIQIPQNSSTSFSGIVSGNGFVCGLRSSSSPNTSIMHCWRFSENGILVYKRLYNNTTLAELEAGNSHICGLVNGTNLLQCWQWHRYESIVGQDLRNFSKIAVGENFICGILKSNQNVACVGSGNVNGVPGGSFMEIASGVSHACAISTSNSLECWGDERGNNRKPQGKFVSVALGENRGCALRSNGTVVCWGENNFTLPESLRESIFTTIEAKRKVFCGVLISDFSLSCWGNQMFDSNHKVFDSVLPGPCRAQCQGSPLDGYGRYCEQGYICSSVPSPGSGGKTGWSNKMVAFLVVGCVGTSCFVLVCCFFLFIFLKNRGPCRVHDSGRLDDIETQAEQGSSQRQSSPQGQTSPVPVLEKRLSHLISMGNNGAHLEEFTLQVLLDSTNNFSEDNKIGTGSFGSVYLAKLDDGREVAIKRAEVSSSSSFIGGTKRQEADKDHAFVRELELLSRLNHKNLVRLLGFYEDDTERVLVYEYMSNGTLHDHLHKEQENSPLMTWPARLRAALDAARGIEYLHEFAVPPIIHRDIKSSNILLDDTWTARVSDFGLSLLGPGDDVSHLSLHAAGTVGYIDPEYFRLQQLTTKSDVYSFGVLLLELLSGHRAIHKNENGVPRNVVDFVVPYVVQDEIHRVLDPKVPPPTPFEIEAVAYIGYLAVDCVALEGRDRPPMTEIVSSLERALAACLARPTLSRSTTQSST